MSLNLNQLPDQISESPSLESLTVAETYSTLLNYHIRNAELQRFYMNFINFFIRTKYDLSLEEYYNVQKSTVSNWRKRKIPQK